MSKALQSSGSQGNLAALKSIASGKPVTLADAGRVYARGVMCPRLVGTAEDIAAELSDTLLSGAADGFIISPAFLPDTFDDFVRDVVPILQRHGHFRTQYGSGTLRDRLGAEAFGP